MGIAGKVRESLDATLELAPKHAEAHTALALYHAEIINKIGAMIGGLTYGAKASEADKHIKDALKLTPDSPIAHIEHGNVLLLLDEKRNEDAAAAAYEKAAGCKPLDAMEALDAAYAQRTAGVTASGHRPLQRRSLRRSDVVVRWTRRDTAQAAKERHRALPLAGQQVPANAQVGERIDGNVAPALALEAMLVSIVRGSARS